MRLRRKTDGEQSQYEFPFREQFRDYFHDGRVLIPIDKPQGKASRLVGYAGRSLAAVLADGAPKYLLSPGLPKAELLFNAPEAFNTIGDDVKGGIGALYLVEGFFDALRLQALGLPAVALMGTSLGKGQRELLEGLVNKLPAGAGDFEVRVLLDGDKAGFSGADRLVRSLLAWRGVRMRWVAIEGGGKDPDSWLQRVGPTAACIRRRDVDFWGLDRKAAAAALWHGIGVLGAVLDDKSGQSAPTPARGCRSTEAVPGIGRRRKEDRLR